MSVLVPRAGGGRASWLNTTLNGGYGGLLRNIRWDTRRRISGMIDRQQLHLIEVDSLFQRLHEAEAEASLLHARLVILSRSL